MDRVDNPSSSLTPRTCEHDVPPPARQTVHEEYARSILTRNQSPDVPYTWSVNPYRGCAHACAYCYARRTHEYLDLGAGTDFDCCLVAKVNAADVLARELWRPGWRREQIAFSGVTDCYQPIERQYGLTRACLAACVARPNPVGIVTKSSLITRDLDLLTELSRRTRVDVCLSIAFADEATAGCFELGAPSIAQRWATVRQLRAAGLSVGVLMAPIIPGLNDRDIPAVLREAARSGASAVDYSPVRLPGTVAEVFLARLRRLRPAAAQRVEARIRDLRGGRLNDARLGCRMSADGAYWESVRQLFDVWATRLRLARGQHCRESVRSVEGGPRQLDLFNSSDSKQVQEPPQSREIS